MLRISLLRPPQSTYSLPIPNDPALVGLDIYTQGFKTPGPMEVTDGFRIRVENNP